jgi:hypothetical protein
MDFRTQECLGNDMSFLIEKLSNPNSAIPEGIKKLVFRAVKDSNIIFYTNPDPFGIKTGTMHKPDEVPDNFQINLPFKKVLLESNPHGNLGFYNLAIEEDDTIFLVRSILIEEICPNEFKLFYMGTSVLDGRAKLSFVKDNLNLEVLRNNKDDVWLAHLKAVYFLLNLIKTGAIAKEKIYKKYVFKIKDKKQEIIVKDLIHIYSKKEQTPKSIITGKIIEWSHRWEVRGHWRKTKSGIGKDRENKNIFNGFTWVVPHEKGAQDLPVTKKIRIIH